MGGRGSTPGGTPVLISETPGSIQAFHHLDKGDRFDVDAVVSQVKTDNYDAFVLPGGVANPDLLRTIPNFVRLVGEAFATGHARRRDLPRPVAAHRGRRRSGDAA